MTTTNNNETPQDAAATVARILEGHAAGIAWVDSLRVGRPFEGAGPAARAARAARAAGFTDEVGYRAFTWTALDLLDRCIVSTDERGILTTFVSRGSK